jgi:hypothetical protein
MDEHMTQLVISAVIVTQIPESVAMRSENPDLTNRVKLGLQNTSEKWDLLLECGFRLITIK